MKKRKKLAAGFIIAFVLCVCIGVRIYAVNQTVEDVPVKIYELGEKVPFENDVFYSDNMKGYSLKVLSAEVKTTEEFLKDYGASAEDIPDSQYSPKVYDLYVEISNEDNTETGIFLWDLQLQSNAAYGSFNDVYYRVANADKGYEDTAVAVRPGTSVSLHLVFGMPSQTFTDKAYENIEDLDMKLVLSLYPTKKMVRLQP